MLEDVDILRLAHMSIAMHWILQRYLERQYRGKTPLLELGWGVVDNAFETKLQDAIEFALTQIRKVGRDLFRNVPYNKCKPHAYI